MSDLELYDALETATDPAERDLLSAECHQRAVAFAQAGQVLAAV
jgi:hypothetical protein